MINNLFIYDLLHLLYAQYFIEYYAKTLSRTFSTARNTSRGPDEDYRQEIFTNFILLTMPCIAKLESQ